MKINILIRIILFGFFCLGSCNRTNEGSSFLNDEASILHIDESAGFMVESTGMPFSDECHSIKYYMRAGGTQDLTMLCRFTYQGDQVEEIISRFIEWNKMHTGSTHSRVTVSASPYSLNILPKDEIGKLSWWNLKENNIIKASICNEGFGCNIWVARVAGGVDIYLYQSS